MKYDTTLKKAFKTPPNLLLSQALGRAVVICCSNPKPASCFTLECTATVGNCPFSSSERRF